MDDQDRASRLTKAVLSGCGLLVLLLVARSALGDLGVQVVLLVALVAVMGFAYGELTGRPVPGLRRLRRADVAEAPPVPDTWRSERWIAEAVERGLRALDEWRWEQRSA
jgi:hypothetical protein